MSDQCKRCGKNPADGYAFVGDDRYCHGDFEPGERTCYMRVDLMAGLEASLGMEIGQAPRRSRIPVDNRIVTEDDPGFTEEQIEESKTAHARAMQSLIARRGREVEAIVAGIVARVKAETIEVLMNPGRVPSTDDPTPQPMELKATTYTICALPAHHPDWPAFAINIDWCGGKAWSVVHLGRRLTRSGEWQWLAKTYDPEVQFDLGIAWGLAEEWAMKIKVNRKTAEDVLKMEVNS